ncbi:2Fe-2S iron-sulfur cluster binding domain-containing protein [Hymenobacter aquaticus]|uniref:2Fe-2S iron-sulfur cluster binding domain-containing protein n=1 Tax=Hymenobacter aquaticus TaxID=1867101 RepID=A0A4Z0Q8B1_9BACT|nr:FAD binding domain-containing protein [Hymenobacter aquaticus]TGE25649.1 2Fe-2S iron-sulfur cluster binding domain-containing protein [Hymenobacter aquaticus]
MLHFYLNNQRIRTDQPAGSTLLDFVRYEQHLKGTKIGCREGDCGACTVLVGELQPDGQVQYQSMTSCLTPLGNAHGKHIVTVEGINAAAGALTPVQQAIVQEGGSQCGFCTVGFVMSLTGHSLSAQPATPETGLAAIDGNICRCTGYKSLERATALLTSQLAARPTDNVVDWLSEHQFVPTYFKDVPARLQTLKAELLNETNNQPPTTNNQLLGGGTDLLVQRPEHVRAVPVQLLYDQAALRGIRQEADGRVVLGAATTAENLRASPIMQQLFPGLHGYMKLVSSTPIRNMGTVAGNFINASPIGDLTIFFLALNATVTVGTPAGARRDIPLHELYSGYKTLTKAADEQVLEISFATPQPTDHFNFEKVSKRTHLDIASVNSALWLRTSGGFVQDARLSAGGVGPTPLRLARTSAFLVGKEVTPATLAAANEIAQTEISPISDARGTAEYKRLLLRQLLFAHFLQFFPERLSFRELV